MTERTRQESSENGHANSDWIYDHSRVLFGYATVKFQIYGRGAVVIDRHHVLVPPKYLTRPEIERLHLDDLKTFVDRYDPECGLVVALAQPDGKQMIFRVDVLQNDLANQANG